MPADDLQPHMPQTVAEATAKGSKVLEFNTAHPGFNAQPSASRVLGCNPGTLQLHGSNMDLQVLGFQVSGFVGALLDMSRMYMHDVSARYIYIYT